MTQTTAWMWASDFGSSGMTLDFENNRLEWFEGISCACGDTPFKQTIEQFLKKGPLVADVPTDIIEEIHQSIQSYQAENA